MNTSRSTMVLLIEDDPYQGPLTVDLLAEHGHAATWTSSPEEALRLLTGGHRFEVVLLDLELAGERGERLIEQMRDAGATIPPIVILSAKPVAELRDVAKAMHAEAFIQKPASVARIIEAIELARA